MHIRSAFQDYCFSEVIFVKYFGKKGQLEIRLIIKKERSSLLRAAPSKFNRSVPCSKYLPCLVTIQVPQTWPIEWTIVHFESFYNLWGCCKLKSSLVFTDSWMNFALFIWVSWSISPCSVSMFPKWSAWFTKESSRPQRNSGAGLSRFRLFILYVISKHYTVPYNFKRL